MDNITKLSDLYYRLAARDHHKDRDCHFYINKVWSYGEPPVYRVEHHGYLNNLESVEFKNYKDAENHLETKLKEFIKELELYPPE